MKKTGKFIIVVFVLLLLCWLGLKFFYAPKYYTDDKSDRWITVSTNNNLKKRIIYYLDSVNAINGKFAIPAKWMYLIPEVDTLESSFDHMVIYFSGQPEEMYFVEFTPSPQIRAVYNTNLDKQSWVWGTKRLSLADQNRIIKRFKKEIISDVE